MRWDDPKANPADDVRRCAEELRHAKIMPAPPTVIQLEDLKRMRLPNLAEQALASRLAYRFRARFLADRLWPADHDRRTTMDDVCEGCGETVCDFEEACPGCRSIFCSHTLEDGCPECGLISKWDEESGTMVARSDPKPRRSP